MDKSDDHSDLRERVTTRRRTRQIDLFLSHNFTSFSPAIIYNNKLCAKLDQHQCPDQAGFRNKFQTTDHFMT